MVAAGGAGGRPVPRARCCGWPRWRRWRCWWSRPRRSSPAHTVTRSTQLRRRSAWPPRARRANPLAVPRDQGLRLRHPRQPIRHADRPQENRASTPSGQLASDLDPLPAARLRPSDRRLPPSTPSAGAVTLGRRGRRPAGRAALRRPRRRRARLGHRVRRLPASRRGLRPAARRPQRPAGRGPAVARRRTHFPGLHRIEKGLWTGAPPRSLVAGRRRRSAARRSTLRRTLPTVPIPPLDYATRAHEILEDAQRDLMSGIQVPVERGRRARDGGGRGGHPRGHHDPGAAAAGPRQHARCEVQNWLAQLQQIARLASAGPTGPGRRLSQLSQTPARADQRHAGRHARCADGGSRDAGDDGDPEHPHDRRPTAASR